MDRRFLRRIHLFAVQLAIIAMLIDALLPSAVSAAMRSGTAAPSVPFCNAATGTPLPAKEAPALPARHCALCAACAACFASLPPRQGDGLTGRLLIGPANPTQPLSARIDTRGSLYRAAQPRAPPAAFS
jgi:hypothetical protein